MKIMALPPQVRQICKIANCFKNTYVHVVFTPTQLCRDKTMHDVYEALFHNYEIHDP